MSATEIRRPTASNFVVGILKYQLDGRDNNVRGCHCHRRADFLLMVFRFICYISYNLFRGALWQYLMVLKTVQYCQLNSGFHMRDKLPKMSYGNANQLSDVEILDDEQEENMNEMCYDNSWIEIDDYLLTDMEITQSGSSFIEDSGINSSCDTVDENVLFVTYLGSEDIDNDSQDKVFNCVSQCTSEIDPLEGVLRQFEIDWDAPFYGQSHEKNIGEDNICSEEYFFSDDDCEDWEANYYDELEFWTEQVLDALPSHNTSDDILNISAVESSFLSPCTVVKNTNGLSMLDDDVLAAITGEPYKRLINTEFLKYRD